MLALLLQCGIFAVFTFVGYGIAVALVPERDSLRNALLSPVLGAAAFTVPAVLLNHLGVPVGSLAWPLTVVLLLFAGIVIYLRRERTGVSWRSLAPFIALLPLAILLTCRPELEFGTNWLSFSNEDMINYASTAQRLIDYGFYAQPPVMDVAAGGQLSQEGFWFHDVLGNERVGVDTLLALVSSIARIRPFNAFMPLIGAGYFMIIWSTAALGLARELRVRLALCIGLAVTLSSLTTLGVLYQLLGQVFGLAGLAGAIALLGEPNPEALRSNPLGQIGLRVLVSAFVVAAYPELFPFVVLAMLLEYFIVPVLERRRPDYIAGTAALISCGLAFLVLWNYGNTMAHVIAARFNSATAPTGDLLFPYFLLPSGFANLWGLVAIADYPGDPYMSLAIVAGVIMLLVQLAAILIASRRIHPAALTALVMLLLAAFFFVKRDDFALFKMTMYVQPFFIASLALGTYGLLRMLGRKRPEWPAGAVAVVFAVMGIGAQQNYVELSRSEPDAATFRFSQLPMSSPRRLLDELDAAAQTAGTSSVAIDAPLPEYAKLAQAYFSNAPLTTLSDDFLNRFRSDRPVYGAPDAEDVHADAQIDVAEFHNREQLATLDVPPIVRADGTPNRFRIPWQPAGKPHWLLELGADASILNRSGDAVPGRLVTLRPWNSVHDHLVLLQTEMFGIDGWSGAWEDGAPRANPTLFRPERDEYGQGTFSGLGRYHAFEAINASGPVRLVMWVSATLKADGQNHVPQGRVYGAETVPLEGVGRGSARIVSEPFEPARFNGLNLIGVDLGEDGRPFRKHISGLMRWFGTDIAVDPRRIVVFGRDISLIPDDDYRSWEPPSWIADLPTAIQNPQLAYSGIYEDSGWVSDVAEVTVRSSASTRRVRVEGEVPNLGRDFATVASLSVDGVVRASQKLGVGPFTLEAPVSVTPGKHAVRLTFSRAQHFPDPDNRVVGARIGGIGFPQ